jgi:hypothetical protein
VAAEDVKSHHAKAKMMHDSANPIAGRRRNKSAGAEHKISESRASQSFSTLLNNANFNTD